MSLHGPPVRSRLSIPCVPHPASTARTPLPGFHCPESAAWHLPGFHRPASNASNASSSRQRPEPAAGATRISSSAFEPPAPERRAPFPVAGTVPAPFLIARTVPADANRPTSCVPGFLTGVPSSAADAPPPRTPPPEIPPSPHPSPRQIRFRTLANRCEPLLNQPAGIPRTRHRHRAPPDSRRTA